MASRHENKLKFIRQQVSVSVQLLSCVRLFAAPRTAACQASLSITNSWSLLKLVSIELVMPSNHFILYPLLPPSAFPNIRIFSKEAVLHIRLPKYPEDCRGNIVVLNRAQEGSMKQEGRRQGTSFERIT